MPQISFENLSLRLGEEYLTAACVLILHTNVCYILYVGIMITITKWAIRWGVLLIETEFIWLQDLVYCEVGNIRVMELRVDTNFFALFEEPRNVWAFGIFLLKFSENNFTKHEQRETFEV